MKQLIFIINLTLILSTANAQTITPQEYIATYKNIAIAEMKRSGIPASVTLAQGILETESGNSDLVKKSNNHFGIKCKKDWVGESVRHTDDAPNECFRKYTYAEDSYKDHSDYLKNTARYAALFELAPSDYKGWAYGLKKAGYATNPRYPQIVISNIEKYNLQQYDIANIDADYQAIIESKSTSIVENKKPLEKDSNVEEALKTNTKFNGLKAIFASKGISILAIATAADIPLVKLLAYNDLMVDGLLKDDQLIYLERKNKQGNRDIYTALQNESMYDIAQNNGIQLKNLAELNNLKENEQIKKGTKVKLR